MKNKFNRKIIILLVIVLAYAPELLGSMPDLRSQVWVDTDPACGYFSTSDVDDCWAIYAALNSASLRIVGISTVFGNETLNVTDTVARRFIGRIKGPTFANRIYRGAGIGISKGAQNKIAAVEALAAALQEDLLTILALGPLTNIALLIQKYPELASRVDRVLAVAGTRPGVRRFFLSRSSPMHFHDLNFVKDPEAFEVVLKSGIPLTLFPFELAKKITIYEQELIKLQENDSGSMCLVENSKGWLAFWEKWLGHKGFHPFDFMVTGYMIQPDKYICEKIPAKLKRRYSRFVERSTLEVSYSFKDAVPVTYCYDASPDVKAILFGNQIEKQSRKESP